MKCPFCTELTFVNRNYTMYVNQLRVRKNEKVTLSDNFYLQLQKCNKTSKLAAPTRIVLPSSVPPRLVFMSSCSGVRLSTTELAS